MEFRDMLVGEDWVFGGDVLGEDGVKIFLLNFLSGHIYVLDILYSNIN
jgi:hypothetical protein